MISVLTPLILQINLETIHILTFYLPRNGWLPPTPYIFLHHKLVNMEYNLDDLSSCRFICAHLEVTIVLGAHAFREFYLK
jgi:hypothetical protein